MTDIKDNKFSILEAYLNTKKIFEDDAAKPADSTPNADSDKPADSSANSETTENPSNNTSGTSLKIPANPSNSNGLSSYVSLKDKFTAGGSSCDYGGNLEDAINNMIESKRNLLRSCFIIGPSKATDTYGNVEIIYDPSAKSKESPKSDSESDSKSDGKSDSGSDSGDSNKKESYSYSIMESYLNLNKSLLLEEDSNSGGNSTNGNDSSSNSSGNSANSSQSNTITASYVPLQFMVGIKDEGYTVWTVAVDTRANLESVKKAILSKEFKHAYEIANKGLKDDGLIPLIAHTFVNKEQHPPFMGHCRYGFGSGEDERSKEGSNTTGFMVALSVAPIVGASNKTSDDLAAQSVYKVLGDITGGKLGETFAAIKKYAKDKISGNSDSSYRSRDTDKSIEQKAVDSLNEYIKNAFEEVGDQEMYADFKKIRDEYLKKLVEKGLVKLESETNFEENSDKFNTKDKLIYY